MLMPNCDSAFAADRRVALVIGNSSYQNAPILANPAKDAEAMAESFKVAGFDVVTALYNLGIKEFLAKLRRFEDEAANADIAVIYYAGHGIEVAGNNFMLPVDAKLVSDRDARDEAVSLDRLLEAVEGAKRLPWRIKCSQVPNLFVLSRSGVLLTPPSATRHRPAPHRS